MNALGTFTYDDGGSKVRPATLDGVGYTTNMVYDAGPPPLARVESMADEPPIIVDSREPRRPQS